MMEMPEMSRIQVLRFDPDQGSSPYYQEYIIPFEKESTILDSLYYIYQHLDGSLAFRGSCFAGGWCNVCAVKVSGRALLPCKHFMEKDMIIEPLPGYPVLRDLIVDYSRKLKNEPGENRASGNLCQPEKRQ
jgi:succinate dehydrogenase/fumarate reductase iron-sulfur protein